jgi:hypothetical protein
VVSDTFSGLITTIPTSGGPGGGAAGFGLLQAASDKPTVRIPITTHDLVLNVACMGTSMVLFWNECSFFKHVLKGFLQPVVIDYRLIPSQQASMV